MSSSIERELERCRQSAEEGYALANAKYSDIKNTLIDAANSLSKTDKEQSQVSRIRNSELVEKQKSELQQLRNRIDYIGSDLNNLRGRMKDFSIVVYGRTMAGKSTLMEILTHGNGESIGKGSQRTTLDVRDYHWNDLKITDVPGICAFEGAEDEKLALEAAKSADLILFLLTSDAPQPDEAACLAQLRSLGKPVLGVINVKMAFNMSRRALSLKKLRDKLNNPAETSIPVEQFKEFAANHNQDWSGIKFVATHLLSAYESQDKDAEVFAASRFAEVEEFILEKVRNDGRFLRIKTFADSISVPMSNVILEIYKHSSKSLLESDVWFDKRRQLLEWREKFLERSQEKINHLYDRLYEELNRAICDFVDYHYEDERAGQNWQRRFESLKFDEKYQEL
ncbi:MAG: 50S ribosome-binding GTPase, partial [Selenomonadaceae bacterium]|nr:50S ribosome-binding GTPase [Selenomonadaceae bacterium]